jgi:serine/threonine-protein kinase
MAIERTTPLASVSEVGDWVKAVGGAALDDRVGRVAAIESRSSNRLRVAARSPMLTPRILEPEREPGTDSARLISQGGQAEGRPSQIAARTPVLAQPAEGERSRLARALNVRLLASVGVVGIALGGLTFALTRRPVDNPSQASAAAPSTRASAESSVPGDSSRVPAAIRVEPQVAIALRPPEVEISPELSSSKPTPIRRAPMPVSRSSHPAAASKRVTCDPPFVIDAQGIRRIKPGCI